MSNKRLNTGVIRNGDDWPGVFIRGDEGDLKVAIRMAIRCLRDQASPNLKDAVAGQLEKQLVFLQSSSVDQETRGTDRADIQTVQVV